MDILLCIHTAVFKIIFIERKRDDSIRRRRSCCCYITNYASAYRRPLNPRHWRHRVIFSITKSIEKNAPLTSSLSERRHHPPVITTGHVHLFWLGFFLEKKSIHNPVGAPSKMVVIFFFSFQPSVRPFRSKMRSLFLFRC